MNETEISIYFIRHAQSQFNAVYDPDKPDPMIFDSRLSELGERQAASTQKNIHRLNITNVIVSPFTRTLQTASLIFGPQYPFEVNALVREQLTNSCDVGSSPDNLGDDYPHLDFSHLAQCWWHDGEKDHRGISIEPHDVLLQRADSFVAHLKNEQRRSMAIVSHGNFIHAITGIHIKNCEILKFDPVTRTAVSVMSEHIA